MGARAGRAAPAYDWVGSLELCSLVTGQAAAYARRHRLRQVVLTWENDPRQPLYAVPPYRAALRRSLHTADLFLCLVDAARPPAGARRARRTGSGW